MSIESELESAVARATAPLAAELAHIRHTIDRLENPVPVVAMKKHTAAQALDMTVRTLNKLIAAGSVVVVTLPTGSEVVPMWSLRQLVGDPDATPPALTVAEAV